MATTTNYGWTTPDDTALVKDGASAIRTLGTSVDTTVKALNPGTTAGDLDYYTAATTKARIAKGTAGQVFTMNSGATAPEWQTLNAGGMTLLSTTTLSGATTTISSISQAYNSLMVVVTGMTGNTADSLFRLLPNGSATEATYSVVNQGTAAQVKNLRITLASVVTTRTNANNSWTIIFNNYASTTANKPFNFYGYFTDGSGTQSTVGGGAYTSTTALSSLTFDYQGTNTFAGGTVLIYGVK